MPGCKRSKNLMTVCVDNDLENKLMAFAFLDTKTVKSEQL